MSFFWVNLGTSYKEVDKERFLWAPAYAIGKNGKKKTNAGWEPVKEVKEGDVIFCNRRENIIYVAVASKAAYPAKRPDRRAYVEWEEDGYQIEVDLTVLPLPINVAAFKETMMAIHNRGCSPALFARNG